MKQQYRKESLFIQYAPLAYNPNKLLETYLQNGNCILYFMIDYYNYFIHSVCFWECLNVKNLFYCDKDYCSNKKTKSEIMECRFSKDKKYKNARYAYQISCVLNKYREFVNGQENDVTICINLRFLILSHVKINID